MSDTVISVENISKIYKLGEVNSSTIASDFKRFIYKTRGKEDPFLKISEENDRTSVKTSGYVKALDDINFTIQKGDLVGILGRNGAGKSTLFKILSRTVAPSTGSLKMNGKLVSLLEVGTGFHPELTGKDNVFLNGAIYGMKKAEIAKRFDEIVSFAGVEKYINTPVKRYSSGMYIRLAFAVAAHLDTDIMILDEVLAVGDLEFQQKCISKMHQVSLSEGRTILFVSHNANAIKKLCNKCLYLEKGKLIACGEALQLLERYNKDISQLTEQENRKNILSENEQIDSQKAGDKELNNKVEVPVYTPPPQEIFIDKQIDQSIQVRYVAVCSEDGDVKESFNLFEKIIIKIEYEVLKENLDKIGIAVVIKKDKKPVFTTLDVDNDEELLKKRETGYYKTQFEIPPILKDGTYTISINISKLKVLSYHRLDDAIMFKISENNFILDYKSYSSNRQGEVVADIEWGLEKVL